MDVEQNQHLWGKIGQATRRLWDFAMVEGGAIARTERRILLALFALMFILRFYFLRHYGVDSDETQHLHVIWSVIRGRMQYRDVFDNHMPLFHLLMAPVASLVGERANIIVLMRACMQPFLVALLWAVFALGRSLVSVRTGLWAALLVGMQPCIVCCMTEFRPDTLWALCWMLGLLALLGGALSPRRALAGGIFMGMAVCISAKSVILAGSLVGALTILFLLRPSRLRFTSLRFYYPGAGWFAAGACAVPLATVIPFMVLGAWQPFVNCVYRHNILPFLTSISPQLNPRPWAFFLLALLIICAWRALRLDRDGERGARAACFFLATGLVPVCMLKLPTLTIQTFMVFLPMLVLSLAMLPSLAGPRFWAGRGRPWFTVLTGVGIAGLITMDLLMLLPHDERKATLPLKRMRMKTARYLLMSEGNNDLAEPQAMERMYKDLFLLTGEKDFVLDPKGESVFRRRPVYYALENFTCQRIAHGLLTDDIPERCVKTRTCVSSNLGQWRYTPRTREFVNKAYIDVGFWRVAGQWLNWDASQPHPKIEFKVMIPAKYRIIGRQRKDRITGTLDGRPYRGAVTLAAGKHVFIPTVKPQPLALVWDRAVQRRLSPFKAQDRKRDFVGN